MKNKTYYTNLPDNKSKIYGGAYSVHDDELVAYRDKMIKQFTTVSASTQSRAEEIKIDFFNTYTGWMFKPFKFKNTNLLSEMCFTQGTTESFTQFYVRFRENHRLRIAKGEYFYHQMMKSLWYKNNFAWLNDDDIKPGDVVLISLPFADTGSAYIDLDRILDQCDQHGVPVMLDLAYLNLTTGDALKYNVDFDRPCIEYVVSSLSKVFPVENMRIGIRFQKTKFEDQLYVINEENYNYINLLSAYVGTHMMKKFEPDYVFNKYRQDQIQMCKQLDLDVSPCFNFGIDYKNKYPQYSRGNTSNRLCFSRIWDGRAEIEGLIDDN